MPKAVLTVREVKNKESGVDVYVPSYTEEHGLLTTTYSYNVLVVSHLPCFKDEQQHRPQDVVQFVISRSDDHFVRLRQILQAKFPEISLPPLNKTNTLFGDVVPKERKLELENFLKKVVASQQLTSYHVTLEFLGVQSMKAYNYCLRKNTQDGDDADGVTEENVSEQSEEPENEAGNDDLFTLPEDTLQSEAALFGDTVHPETGLFSDTANPESTPTRQSRHSASRLFQDQDFGGGVSRTDAPELFLVSDTDVTDASIAAPLGTEEESDLLNIEDDIDKLLGVSEKPAAKPQPPKKPALSTKPTPARKPEVIPGKPSPKPKPAVKPKLKSPTSETVEHQLTSHKELTSQKGTLFMEDVDKSNDDIFDSKSEFHVKDSKNSSRDPFSSAASGDSLNNDDILNYIQQNISRTDDDLDLFS